MTNVNHILIKTKEMWNFFSVEEKNLPRHIRLGSYYKSKEYFMILIQRLGNYNIGFADNNGQV
jgi:hypothetical protein